LNFCNKEFVAIYSIRFKTKEHFSKTAIFERTWNIEFSNQIAAQLIAIDEIAKKITRLNFSYLKIGRWCYGNSLYYQYNDIGFCLPIKQLIYQKQKAGKIEKYVQDIVIKVEDKLRRVNIEVKSLRDRRENNYYGYLDLTTFDFIIEKHEEEFL